MFLIILYCCVTFWISDELGLNSSTRLVSDTRKSSMSGDQISIAQLKQVSTNLMD